MLCNVNFKQEIDDKTRIENTWYKSRWNTSVFFLNNQILYLNTVKHRFTFYKYLGKYRGVPPTYIPRVIILILSSFSSLKLTLHNMLCNVNILCGYKVPRQILDDKIDDAEFLEFAITNFSEMMGYIVKGNLNIRIHRDITGKMWFGVGCE